MKILITVLVLIILGGGYFFMDKQNTNLQEEDKVLDIQGEETESPIVASLGGETLDLSGKGLTEVPSYIFNRTNLVGLDLSNNSLDGALQAEIRFLGNLKFLDLSNNKFTGVPAEIGQLEDLEVLDLSDNLLTGLPNELGNLSNLKLLDVSGNNYSESDLSTIRNGLPSATVIKTE